MRARSEFRAQRLLERIKSKLDDPSDTALLGPVQDCVALARLVDASEWELYFGLQLAGETALDPKGHPPGWRGDAATLQWQPASTFATDRLARSGSYSRHPLETLVSALARMRRDLAEAQFNLDTTSNFLTKLQGQGRLEAAKATIADYEYMMACVRSRVRDFSARIEATLEAEPAAPATPLGLSSRPTAVFVGHGRSNDWRALASFLHERLGLAYEEFNRSSAAGLATTERLSEMLRNSGFALLVLTAEDERLDGSTQARQNVVHELGLFQGRLGFARAIVVLEEGCAEFSNIKGLGQIRFPQGRILAVAEELRMVLEREGLLEPLASE